MAEVPQLGLARLGPEEVCDSSAGHAWQIYQWFCLHVDSAWEMAGKLGNYVMLSKTGVWRADEDAAWGRWRPGCDVPEMSGYLGWSLRVVESPYQYSPFPRRAAGDCSLHLPASPFPHSWWLLFTGELWPRLSYILFSALWDALLCTFLTILCVCLWSFQAKISASWKQRLMLLDNFLTPWCWAHRKCSDRHLLLERQSSINGFGITYYWLISQILESWLEFDSASWHSPPWGCPCYTGSLVCSCVGFHFSCSASHYGYTSYLLFCPIWVTGSFLPDTQGPVSPGGQAVDSLMPHWLCPLVCYLILISID